MLGTKSGVLYDIFLFWNLPFLSEYVPVVAYNKMVFITAKRNPLVSYASIAAKNTRFIDVGRIRQYFSLPFNCIDYILKNPKSTKFLQKLYKTCKYFYAKFPIFVFPETRYYYKRFLSLNEADKYYDIKNPKTLWWFEKELILACPFNTLAEKIFRCSVSFLYIKTSAINLTEFEMLVTENTIQKFYLRGNIIDAEGKNVAIDIILSKLPNLQKLCYYNSKEKYSDTILQKLISLEFNNNLKRVVFCLDYLKPFCDPFLLVSFFRKHVAINAEIVIYFLNPDSENFKNELEICINQWLFSYETYIKPKVFLKRL